MLDYETHRANLDAELAAMNAQWRAEDEADARAARRYKNATIVGAVSVGAVWLAPLVVPQYATIVATVAVLYAVVSWATMWGWAIRQIRAMR